MVTRELLIPGLPAAGAVLMLFAGRRIPGRVSGIVCSLLVLASFLLAITQPYGHAVFASWLPLAGANWGFQIDALSSLMMSVVTGISFLIHVYSVAYMQGDGESRFFGYLNFFVACMLVLVMADNYGLLFLGWEGVGLCSYLLIGFYYRRTSAASAAMKAFVVNRIGDAALLVGLFYLLAQTGSLRFPTPDRLLPDTTVLALLLLGGAIGKSAQFPLYVWLPDAMEGPTPVSALIHAATMVTAGIYLIVRSGPVFQAAPEVLNLIAVLGAITALLAASIAAAQNDIKRILAYSTVSQLGLMFMALGAGAFPIAMFHLFTHAFFKALLFLGAGSLIHALNGEQDIRAMGNLRKALPFTHGAMLVGAMAIAGIPGLSGFFSKDEILAATLHSPLGSVPLFVTGLAISVLTAFYMARLMRMVFYGTAAKPHHPHEPSGWMLAPLLILAIGSVLAGWLWPREHMDWMVAGIAFAASIAGIALSNFSLPAGAAEVLENGWYIDRFFSAFFVRGIALGSGRIFSRFDTNVVDGAVNGSSLLTRLLSQFLMLWDNYVVDGAVRLTSLLVRLASYPARLTQGGQLQGYALAIVAGVLILVGVFFAR